MHNQIKFKIKKRKEKKKIKNKDKENGTKLPIEEFPPIVLCSQKLPLNMQQLPDNGTKIACLLLSVGDHSNIILRVLRSNHKELGKFKDNVIKKKTFGEDEE